MCSENFTIHSTKIYQLIQILIIFCYGGTISFLFQLLWKVFYFHCYVQILRSLKANCFTVLQHTMSLLKKFLTLITLDEKMNFLQSNLHLFLTNLYAWLLIFNTLLKVKTLSRLLLIFLCKSLYKIIQSICILRNSTNSRPTIFNQSP